MQSSMKPYFCGTGILVVLIIGCYSIYLIPTYFLRNVNDEHLSGTRKNAWEKKINSVMNIQKRKETF